MLYVIAKSISKKEDILQTQKTLEALIEPTRKEEGCIKYELLQDHTNPEVFFFDEIWESKERLNAHASSTHFLQAQEQLKSLLESPMEVYLLNKIG
ncbi:antibiotic biosynthesis monooxygenase [Chryseobacterium sp. RG1]|uniref:Antibiotic biosynthesis monooxygenase n=1 Tax=Chryseobacterium tagetis TaxID=2801334 RepID=A0ABS8A5U9_9FLAO|nr:putative quinol monooxygenase [Chryseobacterium tagetis]MCA6067955.1 antibiotic biosynthesis monooxygenase [Chryseobacterium tagetis]